MSENNWCIVFGILNFKANSDGRWSGLKTASKNNWCIMFGILDFCTYDR